MTQAQIIPAKFSGKFIEPLGLIPKQAKIFVVYFAKNYTMKDRLKETSKEIAVLLKKLDKQGKFDISIDDQLADV